MDHGTVTLECPVCKRRQEVDASKYELNILYQGHPYTCGSETCPSHTVMKPVPQ